jgi:hypothetical protein
MPTFQTDDTEVVPPSCVTLPCSVSSVSELRALCDEIEIEIGSARISVD